MRLVVGLVRGVHGLNGAVRVEVLTDRPETRFAGGARLYREGGEARPDGRRRGRHPGRAGLAAALPGGPRPDGRRDAPGRLPRGRGAARRGARPRRPYYWHEIVGLPVRGLDGEELGTVADVYRVAENDVYVVRGGPRGEFDVPAVRDFVRVLAPRRGEMVVDAAALELGPPRPPKIPRPPRPRKGRPAVRGTGRDPEPPRRRPGRGRGRDVLTWPSRSTSSASSRRCSRGRSRRASRPGSRSAASPRSGSTTSGAGGSAATGRSTTRPTAAAPGWSSDPSRSRRPWPSLRRPESHGHPPRPGRRAVPPGAGARPGGRSHLVFLCPRYEGVDERIRGLVDLELSIGDYVLTGGELPALVVIDAVLRLLPGRDRRRPRPTRSRSPTGSSSTRSTPGRPSSRDAACRRS